MQVIESLGPSYFSMGTPPCMLCLQVDIIMMKCPGMSDNENEVLASIGPHYMETNASLACQTPWASDPNYEHQDEWWKV